MDIYVPQEEGAEPKGLVDQLDEAENRIRILLLDTTKLAVAGALSIVKFHEPPYDLQKVAEHVDLSGLVRRKDIQAAA
jgi:hypothetical protein